MSLNVSFLFNVLVGFTLIGKERSLKRVVKAIAGPGKRTRFSKIPFRWL